MRLGVAIAAVGSLGLLGCIDLFAGDLRIGTALLCLSVANALFLF